MLGCRALLTRERLWHWLIAKNYDNDDGDDGDDNDDNNNDGNDGSDCSAAAADDDEDEVAYWMFGCFVARRAGGLVCRLRRWGAGQTSLLHISEV